jgi:predicted regulator of Ras-like GTPase activity (Roadblock/LC7/MglB family)
MALLRQPNRKDDRLNSILYGIIDDYRRSFGTGSIEIILLIDEDAKILANASPYDSNKSIYDLSVLSAALYGIATEGSERFTCEDFNTCLLAWRDQQIFIQSIGVLKLEPKKLPDNGSVADQRKERTLILAALTDDRVNIGLMRVKLKGIVGQILKLARESSPVISLLEAKEEDLEQIIKGLDEEMTPTD